MPEMAQIFTQELPNRRKLFNVKLFGPYWCHIWPILGPYLSYFFIIFACRCLKWLKFSLKCYACQIEKYYKVILFWSNWSLLVHVRALFWLFLSIHLILDAKNGLKFCGSVMHTNYEITLMLTYWDHIGDMLWPY